MIDYVLQNPGYVAFGFMCIGGWVVMFYMSDKWDRILNGPSEINNDKE